VTVQWRIKKQVWFGLVWSRCALGQTWSSNSCTGSESIGTWGSALAYAQQANTDNYLGAKDWRLPNLKELASIVEESCYDPAINTTVFPNTPNVWFWSASVDANNPAYAWGVDFYVGDDYEDSKDDSLAVRLVRGGQSFSFVPLKSVDLNVTVSGTPNPAKVNKNLTYTALVTNNGTGDATEVKLYFYLPRVVKVVTLPSDCKHTGIVECTFPHK